MSPRGKGWLILGVCCVQILFVDNVYAEDHALCKSPDQDVVILERQQPVFPYFAGLYCIEGWVELEFTINTSGHVEDIDVLDSSAPGVFDSAAETVKYWKFLPRCKNGQPLNRRASQTIDYMMGDYSLEHCPVSIPDQLIAALINITSVATELTDRVNNNQSIAGYLPLVAVSSGELGQLEQIHLDHMAHALEVRAQWYKLYPENNYIDALHQLLSPAYLQADVDFSNAQELVSSVQQSIVSRWQTYLQLNAQFRQSLHEASKQLGNLDAVSRAILIDNTITDQMGGVELVTELQKTEQDIAQRYHDLALWLHQNRPSWQPDGDQFHFDDEADADYYADRVQELDDQISFLQDTFYIPLRIAAKSL